MEIQQNQYHNKPPSRNKSLGGLDYGTGSDDCELSNGLLKSLDTQYGPQIQIASADDGQGRTLRPLLDQEGQDLSENDTERNQALEETVAVGKALGVHDRIRDDIVCDHIREQISRDEK
ncbi:unnamed protein product, partial [Dovyalis caffra]